MTRTIPPRRGFYAPLFLLPFALFLVACGAPKKPQEISYVPEKDIPRTIAVMPARLIPQKGGDEGFKIKPGSEDEAFVDKLVRGVINNQLTGKGYETIPLNRIDRKLAESPQGKDWQNTPPQELCKILGANGLVFPEILSAVMLKTVAYDEYSIEVRITLINQKGENLGSWKESASKRKIAIPTSAIGALATVAVAAMDEPAKKHMRLVIYDWGWKISQFMPDSPHGKDIPEILLVTTNVDQGIFGTKDRIEVEVNAEKGLTCTFDLGDFKKGIPMHYTDSGSYKGSYVVREGEQAELLTLTVHAAKPNGLERTWSETGTVTIDAVAPPPPTDMKAVSSKTGVSLSWSAPESKDLSEFVVERSLNAVGDFETIQKSKDLQYLDTQVAQGKRYYYRIRSADIRGNNSDPTPVQDITMPYFDAVKLPPQFKGTLVPGTYLVAGECSVPEGATAALGPGTWLKFSPGAVLVANGVLTIAGDKKTRVFLEGQDWSGIKVPARGRVLISYAAVSGCTDCIQADGGLLEAKNVSLQGKKGTGVTIAGGSPFQLSGIRIKGFETGIAVSGGKGRIEQSDITGNLVGLAYSGGTAEILNNNIFDNRDAEISADRKLVLDRNYLGSENFKTLKLKGDVLVASLLNAPYPKGNNVVLIDRRDVTPELMEAQFEEFKAKGIEAFKNRKFGDAHQALVKALDLREDKEVFLYLAYTQMLMGDADKSEKTLKKGIQAFPYEVRLYQVYARQLAARGEKDQALKLVEKALRMNPDDTTLKVLKSNLMGEPPPTTQSQTKQAAETPKTDDSSQDKKPDFETLKAKGIEAFKNKAYAAAERYLKDALTEKPDRNAYLYLIYTQMRLSKENALMETLDKSLQSFPDEVRFYRLYVKHLADKGESQKALQKADEGLKQHPDDFQLKMLQDVLQESLKGNKK